MKAVIPAAGVGSRLRPLTNDKPKALVEVAGEPLLTHVLGQLDGMPHDFDEYVVIVGYEGEQIINRYGDAYEGTPIVYEWQEEQAGLGHAILQAEPHIPDGEPFVEHHADNVFDANVGDVPRTLAESDADAVVFADSVTREEATEYGVLDTDGDGEVVDLVEKPDDPPTTLVQSGLFGLSHDVFDALREIERDRGEYRLGTAIQRFINGDDRTVRAVEMDGWWKDVGYPEDREAAEEYLSGDDRQ